MALMYKLVAQDYTTHGGIKWDIGVTNKAKEPGNEMCSPQVLHCYEDPYLAVLFNPAHADIHNPRLLEIECSEIINSDGLKFACKEQTPTREIDLPTLTMEQRVEFAIRVALCVYKGDYFAEWAWGWLSGDDRSEEAARAARAAAAEAAAAAWAARAAEARAAAEAEARAAAAAREAAAAAAWAVWAAARAAAAAAWAARAADKIDFKAIIYQIISKEVA